MKGVNVLPIIKISLAAARVNAGLSQDDVARVMHVSKNTVVSWEKYKTEPSVSQGIKLSELYNLPLDVINMRSDND